MLTYFKTNTLLEPIILLNSAENCLYFAGRAIPSGIGFFSEASELLDDYFAEQPTHIHFEFEMYFYNNVFSLIITDMFRRTANFQETSKCKVTVLWKYDEDDEDMQEEGEDFQSIYPFDFRIKEILV